MPWFPIPIRREQMFIKMPNPAGICIWNIAGKKGIGRSPGVIPNGEFISDVKYIIYVTKEIHI